MAQSPFQIDPNLWIKILIGMALGLALGLILSPSTTGLLPQETAIQIGSWIALPGVIFLGLLKMIVIPLVICSIILGIMSSGNLTFFQKLGFRIIPYFIVTTFISISIGVLLVHLIQPAQYIDSSLLTASIDQGAATTKLFDDLTIPDRIANLIPTNFTRASFEKNMLQIVIASVLLGIVILKLPKKTTQPFVDLCHFGQEAVMVIIGWAMRIAPIAVFGLICNITLKIGFDSLAGVGSYMLTVLAGLFCMLLVYLAIIKLITSRSILSFLSSIREVQIFAFSTSSSAATMPITLKAAQEKLGIDQKVSGFVIPLGATINMDGTAMYQAVAALFLCSIFGVDLTGGEILLLMLTTVGASIGTPATPGVGIIVLATILAGIGVPPEGIGIILGVDRILDMCRTTVNVTGDLTATAVMNKWLTKS